MKNIISKVVFTLMITTISYQTFSSEIREENETNASNASTSFQKYIEYREQLSSKTDIITNEIRESADIQYSGRNAGFNVIGSKIKIRNLVSLFGNHYKELVNAGLTHEAELFQDGNSYHISKFEAFLRSH